jgi:PAS domain S-box-containing protein
MTWQSTILSLLLLINTGVALIILQTAWQRRHTQEAVLPFCWMVVSVAIWSFAGAMELMVSDLSFKIFWSKIQYFGITSLPVLWLLFALEYSQFRSSPFLQSRTFNILLWIIPVLTLLLALTNEWHGLIWSEITLVQTQTGSLVRYEHGLWFWVFTIYGYVALVAGTGILIFGAARFSPKYRRQTTYLLLGAAIPWIANFAYLSGLTASIVIDLTPVAFCLTSVIYAYQVFRFHLFSLVPVAHDSIVDGMNDGVLVLDLQARVLYNNPMAQNFLQAGEMVGNTIDSDRIDWQAISSNPAIGFQQVYEIPEDDHSVRYLDCHANPLYDHHGHLTGQIIVLSDITERKQEQDRFRSYIGATPDGILVIDPDGLITMSNPQAERMLGYHSDEFSLMPLKRILPEYTGPEFAGEGISGDPNARSSITDHETRALSKDGRELSIEINLNRINTPEGPLTLVLLRDLARQKAAEEQINQQAVALAAAASAIMITDRDGRITWVNPSFCHASGYAAEEAIGMKPSLLKSGVHDQDFYAGLWETILSGESWHGELTNRRKDGSLFIEETTIVPVRNTKGEITHFIAVKQDITKRKELEDTRDEFMQTIVHDLRNPLTSILFALDMIKDQPDTLRLPPEMAKMIAISRDNSWRMLGMVNAMLDLSKLEGGKMPLQREPITLAELVEQSFRFQSQLAAQRELLLLNDVPYDLPTIYADRTLISRVLQNLIDNAIKYAPQGSNITIQACVDSPREQVLITIHDDGPGIPAEMRSQLFQKFTSEKSARGGTGLGLAYCRLAIEAHKGEIWVECEEGQGTTFLFTLPIEPHADSRRSKTI